MLAADVAKILESTVTMVDSIAASGQLKSYRTAEGHQQFDAAEVERFARTKDLALQTAGRSGYRILIVDDDRAFATMLTHLIQTLPYKIESEIAFSGFQAGFRTKQNEPDLILMDIVMSGLSGIEVAAALKESPQTRHVRIVGMTGGATQGSKSKMIKLGVEKVLHKPFRLEELVSAIGEEELTSFTGHPAI